MEIYDLMFVTIINILVSKIDGWINSIINHLFSLKKSATELMYDIYYGPSLTITHTSQAVYLTEYPKIAVEAYKTIAEYLQLQQESFVYNYGKIVGKPVSIGNDKLSVSFDKEVIPTNPGGKEQHCNYIVTIKSRMHTTDEFREFFQGIVDRSTSSVAGKKIIDMDHNKTYFYGLDETDKIYYPEIVDAINNVVSTKVCGNFLLHGPPGTGKTNLIKHIANHFDAVVFVVNFNHVKGAANFRQMLGDTEFFDLNSRSATHVTAKKRFYLFEDFDSTKTRNFWEPPKKKEKKDDYVELSDMDGFTYADLINALDGFIKVPGAYTFWTTNYLERINPSFYRPGRMHYTAYIAPLSTKMANEFVDDHFADEHNTEAKITRNSVTIAELHSILNQTSDRSKFVTMINDMYIDRMMAYGCIIK